MITILVKRIDHQNVHMNSNSLIDLPLPGASHIQSSLNTITPTMISNQSPSFPFSPLAALKATFLYPTPINSSCARSAQPEFPEPLVIESMSITESLGKKKGTDDLRSQKRPKSKSKRHYAKPIGVDNFDVLLGRGRQYTRHPGNQRLQTMVEQRLVGYRANSRCERRKLKLEILRDLHRADPPGRIIKYDDDLEQWVEVSESYAVEKISECFQNNLRAKKTKG